MLIRAKFTFDGGAARGAGVRTKFGPRGGVAGASWPTFGPYATARQGRKNKLWFPRRRGGECME